MPDAISTSPAEFAANFGRYEADTSGADVVKIIRDGHVVGGCLSARELAHDEHLRRREAEVLTVGELPPDVVAGIEAAEYGAAPP